MQPLGGALAVGVGDPDPARLGRRRLLAHPAELRTSGSRAIPIGVRSVPVAGLGRVRWILFDESRDAGGSWRRRRIALIPGVSGRSGGVDRGRLGAAIADEDPPDTP
ncbi:hypothetical protein GCM10009609_10410 [Pseudonocardia aurantiaca]